MSSISESHRDQAALEQDIKHIQSLKDPFTDKVPEERLKGIVASVAQSVLPQVLGSLQLKALFQIPSASETATRILLDKEGKAGLAEHYQTQGVIQKLRQTLSGQELLMRVAHAVTDGILSLPGLDESNVRDLHGAAMQFAAQPLIQALNGESLSQEDALVESAVSSSTGTSSAMGDSSSSTSVATAPPEPKR